MRSGTSRVVGKAKQRRGDGKQAAAVAAIHVD
jgi:hypothetical protein